MNPSKINEKVNGWVDDLKGKEDYTKGYKTEL
jgi:hypothetical protein